jgi:hypothetical protein
LWGTSLDIQGQWNLLAWWGAIYLGLTMWIDRRWRYHEAMKKNVTDV